MGLVVKLFGEKRLSEIYRAHAASQVKEGMELAFHDDKGRKWWQWKSEAALPPNRTADAQSHLEFMAAGLSAKTWEQVLDAVDVALAHGKVTEAGAILQKCRDLQKKIVNFDAMVNVIAVYYLREDEDPLTVDPVIHQEKCNFLKSEYEGGRFFFRLPLLMKLLDIRQDQQDILLRLYSEFQAEMKSLKTSLDLLTSKPLGKK